MLIHVPSYNVIVLYFAPTAAWKPVVEGIVQHTASMPTHHYQPVNAGLEDEQTTSRAPFAWSHQADKKATSRARKTVTVVALISALFIAFVFLNAYVTASPSSGPAIQQANGPEIKVSSTIPTPSLKPSSAGPYSPSKVSQDTMEFELHPLDHINREPKTIHETWRITAGERRPDGVLKRVYLINDHFPGPTIEARSGDQLKIAVENALQVEQLSLQWLGLPDNLASPNLAAGETTTIDFTIGQNQHGPFWYSAVNAAQKNRGLYGGLFIHEPSTNPPPYAEYLLLASDWYHSPPSKTDATTPPDSILLNGAGLHDCSSAPASVDCEQKTPQDLAVLSMLRQKRNVFHIINVGASMGFRLSVPDSQLSVIGLNGNGNVDAEPAKSVGVVKPGFGGDRLSLVVEPTSYGSAVLRLEIEVDSTDSPSVSAFPVKWIGLPQGPPDMPDELSDFFDLDQVR